MVATAKLFQNGQSQAVRLPKEFRFDGSNEVFIKKINDMIILLPKNKSTLWNNFFENLDGFSDDFMQSRIQLEQHREGL